MIYIKGSALFKCHVVLPENYSPENSYPLVVGLHGGGGNADDFITRWDDFPHRSFIYAVPQAPNSVMFDEDLVYDWAMWPTRDEELIAKATRMSEDYIVDVIQELSGQYKVDGVYLMGFSQGAIFTYLVGIKQHHLFQGLICLSGPGILAPLINPFTGSFDPDWLPEESIRDAKKMRLFITHGKEDQAAGYELGIRSRDILTNRGHDVTFRDFEGGHIMPPKEILKEIVDWIETSNLAN
ncbi:MAG: hypothetical protein MUO76_15675 [Anaerolineaceae bacterium]|jgi:phospholipase/carboxylesterase|nr:hypothetical protein [Anaerolineaceae bacterium]